MKNGMMVLVALCFLDGLVGAEPVKLWCGGEIPKAAEMRRLAGVEFAVIKRHEPQADGFKWLHGVALCWHKGLLYASYGTNCGRENTPTEETHVRASADGGRTWGKSCVVARGGAAPIGISHGSMASHNGTLWVFSGAFTNDFAFTHTRAYTLDEAKGVWEDRGVVAGNGFWPMQEPRRLPDGNWIMGGLRASTGWNLPGGPRPAVAVSHGDDFTRWDVVPLLEGDLPGGLWGEATVDVWGPCVTLTVRPGWNEHPYVAHVATSADGGRTWTPLRPTNLPLATSKPFTGMLSTGVRYVISQTTADGGPRRSPLTIAWSRPGEWAYSQVAVIRPAVFPEGPGESSPEAALSYPFAVEHGDRLYVGYSNSGPGRGNDNSAEVAMIPLSVFSASAEKISVWRGETFSWRQAITNSSDKALTVGAPSWKLPDGVTMRAGLLEDVKYRTKPETGPYATAPDYPAWNASRVVPPGGVAWQVAEVTVTAAARPGVYPVGPFDLEIVDRELPPPAAWKYYLDLWQHPWAVARFHGVAPFSAQHYAKMEPLWRLLARSGQKVLTATLVDLPWNHQCQDGYESLIRVTRTGEAWFYDFTRFDEYVAFGKRCGIGPDIALYTMCPWGYRVSWHENGAVKRLEAKPGTPFFEAYWGAYLPALVAHLKARGWYEHAYIAMDEREPEDLAHISAFLKRVAPDFRVSMAGDKPPSKFKDLTLHSYSQILPDVTPAFRAEVPARRATGMVTTFYVCCGPRRPNTFMDSTAGEAFWCGFYPAAAGLDGFLRWAYNSWPVDPRADASYGHWASGDTFLVYPDAVPSWRFLELTDGIRQAEKHRILRETGALPPAAAAELVKLFDLRDGLAGRTDYPAAARRARALLSVSR